MPLLDADLAQNPPKDRKARPLSSMVWVGIAALAIAIVIGLVFLFAPKKATETLSRVVEAAQSLVKKDPPKPADKEEDDKKPPTFSGRGSRRTAALGSAASAALRTLPPTPGPAEAIAPESTPTPVPHADVPLGASRRRVRELLGEPDLAVFKLEKDNPVEHLVYVSQAQNYATTILLVQGRVVSVYGGSPSVIWKGEGLPASTRTSSPR